MHRDLENQLRAYITDSFLTEAEAKTFTPDSDLLALLDSLEILRMVIALENRHGVKIHESELSPDNLGSVRKLAAFLAQKQQAAQVAPTT
jgi:acyl carrier protein